MSKFPMTSETRELTCGLSWSQCQTARSPFTNWETSRPFDETEYAARFGAGVDVYFGRHVGMEIGASYLLPTGDLDDLDYVSGSIGLFYRF